MKKFLCLLLGCMLMMSSAFALEAEESETVVLRLVGYAAGQNAEELNIEWSGDWVSGFEYLAGEMPSDMDGETGLLSLIDVTSTTGEPATGPLEAGKKYMLGIIMPLSAEEVPAAEELAASGNFDIEGGCEMKQAQVGFISADGSESNTDAIIFIFTLGEVAAEAAEALPEAEASAEASEA